eukprot:5757641-Prorocentrum_lima.AAC.1
MVSGIWGHSTPTRMRQPPMSSVVSTIRPGAGTSTATPPAGPRVVCWRAGLLAICVCGCLLYTSPSPRDSTSS